MDVTWYVVLSAVLFAIGAGGVLIRRSPLVILLCLELMLNAGNLALVAFSRAHGNEEGQVFALIVMPSAFLIGSRWGSAGVATAWMIAYPIIVAPVYVKLFVRIGLTVRDYLAAIGPAISGTVAMAVAVLLARWSFPDGLLPVGRSAGPPTRHVPRQRGNEVPRPRSGRVTDGRGQACGSSTKGVGSGRCWAL